MSDQEKRETVEDQLGSSFKVDWLTEVSNGLLWLNDRAWPLAGGVLFTATMYVFKYIQDEKVPLSITSPSVIAALPIIFALLSFFIAVTALLFLIPTTMLLTPMTLHGDHLIGKLEREGSGKRGKALRATLIFGWLSGLSALGVIVWLAIFIPAEWRAMYPNLVAVTLPILVVSSAVVFVGFFLYVQGLSGLRWRDVSAEFKATCMMGSVLQLFALLFFFSSALAIVRNGGGSYVHLLGVALLGILGIGVCQVIAAVGLSSLKRSGRSFSVGIFITIFGLMLLLLLTPVSSKLAGFALQVTASGGRACTVLRWTPDAAAITKLFEDPKRKGYSQNLRIWNSDDGYYQVRPFNVATKEIWFIPRASVAGVDGCIL